MSDMYYRIRQKLLPFQGEICHNTRYPGRCPGLLAGCPFRPSFGYL